MHPCPDYTNELPNEVNLDSKTLPGFLEDLLGAQGIHSGHLEFLLIKSSKVSNSGLGKKAFLNQRSTLDPGLCLKLLKECSEKKHLLSEVIKLLAYDGDKISSLIEEAGSEDHLCNCLLKVRALKHNSCIMSKLSRKGRTILLLNRIQAKKPKEDIIMLLIKSGEIESKDIDMSEIIETVLTMPIELLKLLLAAGVDPNGRRSSTERSPLSYLAVKCSSRTVKLDLKCKIVEMMQEFVDAGANMEDLDHYFHRSYTTPLHVATDLALRTGEL